MTKLRTPLTFADALTRIVGTIGYAPAATLVGRSERCIYDWADPDSTAKPTLDQALALDAAYRAAGGDGAPILEAYSHQLDVQIAALTADRRELLEEAADAVRECGEAVAAAITVSASNASPLQTHHALTQATEAHTATGALVRRLTSFLPFGAGPGAGNSGDAK